jgi:hypothetical protein
VFELQEIVMTGFRSFSLGLTAALLLAPAVAFAADAPRNEPTVEANPNVKLEAQVPAAGTADMESARDSTILQRSAAKRRGENPDEDTSASGSSSGCWSGGCNRSDWSNGIRTNRGPNVTTAR